MTDKISERLNELDREHGVVNINPTLDEVGQGRGNFGHEGRPGHIGGSAPQGSPPNDMPPEEMTDADVIKDAKRGLRGMMNNVNSWAARDNIMTMANDFLGTDYVSLGGEEGQKTARRLAKQLLQLPPDQLLQLYDKHFEGLGMWGHESALKEIDYEHGVVNINPTLKEAGQGRGNWGHQGRPGHVGGSSPEGGGPGMPEWARQEEERRKSIPPEHRPPSVNKMPTGINRRASTRTISDVVSGFDDIRKGVAASIYKDSPRMEEYRNDPDVFSFAKTYFYTFGEDENSFAQKLWENLNRSGFDGELLGSGNHFAPFKGGAGGFDKDNSFFWAVFRVRQTAKATGSWNQP